MACAPANAPCLRETKMLARRGTYPCCVEASWVYLRAMERPSTALALHTSQILLLKQHLPSDAKPGLGPVLPHHNNDVFGVNAAMSPCGDPY